MARRRMIDPNFWTSEDVSELSIRQRLLLIGLFSNADDEGKGKGKPAAIRSAIFPYEDISLVEIKEDLIAITRVISVIFYEVQGNSFYKFMNWKKWQRVDKPQGSLIPDYEENDSKNGSKNGSSPHIDPYQESFPPKGKERKGKEEKTKENVVAIYNPFKLFESEGFGTLSQIIGEKIGALIDEYGERWVCEAMKISVLKGKRYLGFVDGVLKNWRSDGIDTPWDRKEAVGQNSSTNRLPDLED